MKDKKYVFDDEGRIKTKNPFVYFTDKHAKEGYVPNREMTFFLWDLQVRILLTT